MSTNQNQPNLLGTEETQNSSQPPSEREQMLATAAALFRKELSQGEIDVWKAFLDSHPLRALQYAFDQHNRNGRFFPRPKDILELIDEYKKQHRTKFIPCGQNGCEDGWVRVFEGMTAGGNPIDPHFGAVKRCQCWKDYMRGAA